MGIFGKRSQRRLLATSLMSRLISALGNAQTLADVRDSEEGLRLVHQIHDDACRVQRMTEVVLNDSGEGYYAEPSDDIINEYTYDPSYIDEERQDEA